MNLWLLFLLLGGITLVQRLSFILWSERWTMPPWLGQGLRYVPVAVLSALILPSIMRVDGALTLSLFNPKLIGAVVAVCVAWRTNNVLLTIILGMAIFWGIESFQ